MQADIGSFFDSNGDFSEYVQPIITSPTGIKTQSLKGSNLISVLSPVILKGMNSGTKSEMYNNMYNVFSDDLSLRGMGLLGKKSVRQDYLDACLALDDVILKKFNMPNDLDKYSLLALLAALACTGLKNVMSSALSVFSDSIGEGLLGGIVEPFLSIYTGKDVGGIIDDIHATPSLRDAAMSSTLGVAAIGAYERNSGLFGTDDERAESAGNLLGSIQSVIPAIGIGGGKAEFGLDLFGNSTFNRGIKDNTKSKIPSTSLSTSGGSPIDLSEAISLF